jgi:hypothetical protein
MADLDFSITHPTYQLNHDRWREAFDCYRGGHHYTDPGRTVGTAGFWVHEVNDVDESSDPHQQQRRSRYETVPTDSYLWSHVRESTAEYSDRKARATHVPLFRHVVDIYVSAALRTEPTGREVPETEPWGTYWDDVDRRGTNIGAFVRQAATYALVFGYEFAVTDKPRFDQKAASRAEQLARGERAYSYLVSPLNVPRWALDDSGAFRWVVVRESSPDVAVPGLPAPDTPPEQYRVWYPDHFELYRGTVNNRKETTWVLDDSGPHPCGEVPVAVMYARRSQESRHALESDSMLADLVRADRDVFNQYSLLRDQIYKQCFAQLFLPEDMGGGGAIETGPGVAVTYNAQAGSPIMLSPEASLILAQWRILGETLHMFREFAAVGRGKAEYSKEERSGQALEVESRNENNRVASVVESVEEFDRTLHRHAAAWEGLSDYPKATYGRDVSLRSLGAQINDALSLKALGVPAATMREVLSPLVTQHMREQGQTPDAIKRAVESLASLTDTVEAQAA